MAKWLDRLISLALFMQPVYEKENTEFKTAFLHLETDLVSHPYLGIATRENKSE